MRAAFVLITAILLAAPAQAQIQNPDESTPTTLYFHIWDAFNKFVINTQPFNASFFEVGGVNFPTIEANSWDFNTLYGYSTAGPVEYDFIEAGRPRIHPERGIAADVRIDDTVQPVVYLYIDARGLFGGDDSPATLPEFTFRAQMKEGDEPGSDLDAGAPIMSGESVVHLFDGRWCPSSTPNANGIQNVGCPGDAYVDPYAAGGYDGFPTETPDGTPILYPDPTGVIEVAIPMTPDQNIIGKESSYNIRLDWYQTYGGAFEPDTYAPGSIRLVLDETHLPRLEMNILNPIYIEFIHPQVAAGTLLIHTGVNSPWGTYDIDVEGIQLTVEGPAAPQTLQRVVAQNKHVHDKHDEAAEITYLWKFRDENAPNGDYTIRMSVPNLNGTAVATGTAGFTIEGKQAFGVSDTGDVVEPTETDTKAETPAPALWLLLVALAFVRRWR